MKLANGNFTPPLILTNPVATAMSHWTQSVEMSTVPTLMQRSPVPRVAPEKLLQFEEMLDAADAASNSAFAARKRRREEDSPCAIGAIDTNPPRVSLSFGESDEEEDEDQEASAESIAHALVKTIAATTGVEAPHRLQTTRQAVAWASKAIVDSRTTAVTSTRRERCMHALDPEQTVQAMELINSLQLLISSTRSDSTPTSFTPRGHAHTLPQS